MRTKLRDLGNSRGIVIPKPFIDALGLGDAVDLVLEGTQIVIRKARKPRDGWGDGPPLALTNEESDWLESGLISPGIDSEWVWD